MSDRTTELRDAIGGVVDRWYRAGLIRFRSDDDGSDDLLLCDELTRAARASQPEPAVTEALRYLVDAVESELPPSRRHTAIDGAMGVARSVLAATASPQAASPGEGER